MLVPPSRLRHSQHFLQIFDPLKFPAQLALWTCRFLTLQDTDFYYGQISILRLRLCLDALGPWKFAFDQSRCAVPEHSYIPMSPIVFNDLAIFHQFRN